MTINTSTELVRYIRHHLAGSEFSDVKAVDDFVAQQTRKLQEALDTVRELRTFDQKRVIDLEKDIDRLKREIEEHQYLNSKSQEMDKQDDA